MTDLRRRLAGALGSRYQVQEELGEGGMAVVFRARDLKHGRQVAVKVLRPEVASLIGPSRFLQEIRIAANLQHPHIVALHDSGEADGLLYYVMPYVEGPTLRQRITNGPLKLTLAARLLREMAGALEYAHRHGVVHRDIKPDNVLLAEGHVAVADFGIAKALSGARNSAESTAPGFLIGTPKYMAPEQIGGGEVDQKTDVYALGVVGYEMLTGRPPFEAASAEQLLAAHQYDRPEDLRRLRPEVPDDLAATVMACLEKNPDLRPSAAEIMAEAGGQVDGVAPAVRTAGRRWHWLAYLTVALAALAAALFFGRPAAPAAIDPSVAVLPFVDRSPAGDQQYFADGLAEALISTLSRVEGLSVAPLTSPAAGRYLEADAQTIGRELDVASVLEASVMLDGDHLRVTARLIGTRDGFQLWSDQFDRTVKDVFEVQDQIAREISSVLEVTLVDGAPGEVATGRAADPEAYDEYLRGRYFWRQRTGPGLLIAVNHFERAVELDPDFALAWVGLADSYALFPPYVIGSEADSSHARALAAADEALRLAPDLAEAHAAMGLIRYTFEYDWAGAEAAFQRAIQLNPSYPPAHHWYGFLLARSGRYDQALERLRRARELDPLSLVVNRDIASTMVFAGEYQEAINQHELLLELDSTFTTGWLHSLDAYLYSGRPADARNYLAAMAPKMGVDPDLAVAALDRVRRYLDTGSSQQLPEGFIEQLSAGRAASRVPWWYTATGNHPAALTELEELYRRRSPEVMTLLVDSMYRRMADDIRYQRLLEITNLAQFAPTVLD